MGEEMMERLVNLGVEDQSVRIPHVRFKKLGSRFRCDGEDGGAVTSNPSILTA